MSVIDRIAQPPVGYLNGRENSSGTLSGLANASRPNEPPSNRRGFKEESVQARHETNKGTKYQALDQGLDYLHLSFPIYKPDYGRAEWNIRTKRRNGIITPSGILQITKSPAIYRLQTFQSRDGTDRCSLHLNPALIVDPDGIMLCSPEDILPVISEVVGELSCYVCSKVALEEMMVRRLDVARNFYDIEHPARYLLGLEVVPRPYARETYLYRNSSTLIPETLFSGSDAGWVRLYDKGLQDPERAAPGTLRAELEAKKDWCRRYGGIVTTADLSKENVDKLFQNRMQWFGLENEVMTFETARKQILFSDEIGSRRKVGLLKYMYDLEESKFPKVGLPA